MPPFTPAEQRDRFLRGKQVWTKLGISRSHFYALVQKGAFPSGFFISTGVKVWRESVVDRWILERENSQIPELDMVDREGRRKLAVNANKTASRDRWKLLYAEWKRNPAERLKDFCERRCSDGADPYRYQTRTKSKTYPFETMLRALRKVHGEMHRALP